MSLLRPSKLIFAVLLAGMANVEVLAEVPENRPPNIVLILADDLGAECFGCYGGTSYQTPNLDRMASQGIRFDRCYACPLCSPSRAELLTGRYCFRSGITHVTHCGGSTAEKLDVARHRTLANFLQKAGYATCIVAKWHLCNDFADNPTHVADAGFGHRFLWRLLRGHKVVRHYWNPELWLDGPADDLGRGKFGDDLFTDYLVDFMREHRTQPFFAYYPMTLVHSQTATGKNFPASPDTLRSAENPNASVHPKQKGFADLVAYTDKLVGRILRELDAMGLQRNTLVVFTGDNGTDRVITSRLGSRNIPGGKGHLDEAGTRVPLIAFWPGKIEPGTVAAELVDFTDFLPTLLDAVGVEIPEDYAIDGRSFLPRLLDEPFVPRDWVYSHLGNRWYIRGKQYRLNGTGNQWNAGVLWDLHKDPYAPKPAENTTEAKQAQKRLSAAVKALHTKGAAGP